MSSYRFAPTNWREQFPLEHEHREVADVCIDGSDRAYLFTRGERPYESEVLVYERDGTFVRGWGRGVFKNAHGISLGLDGAVYCVDNYDHTVRKFSPFGELLMELGTPGEPSDTGYDPKNFGSVPRVAGPFNACTKVAVAPNGDFYVSDGYGNARVHHFNARGELQTSWGEPGSGPGQFHLPHGIWVLPDRRIIVADRENDRLQFFDAGGNYLDEWTDLRCPCSMHVDRDCFVYVVELSTRAGRRSYVHGIDPEPRAGRVSIFSPAGTLVSRWGEVGIQPGQFIAPHGIAVDSHGDVYISETTWNLYGKHGDAPAGYNQIQKFTRMT
jgi:DNA-binding beta-propeller fold protein YncE